MDRRHAAERGVEPRHQEGREVGLWFDVQLHAARLPRHLVRQAAEPVPTEPADVPRAKPLGGADGPPGPDRVPLLLDAAREDWQRAVDLWLALPAHHAEVLDRRGTACHLRDEHHRRPLLQGHQEQAQGCLGPKVEGDPLAGARHVHRVPGRRFRDPPDTTGEGGPREAHQVDSRDVGVPLRRVPDELQRWCVTRVPDCRGVQVSGRDLTGAPRRRSQRWDLRGARHQRPDVPHRRRAAAIQLLHGLPGERWRLCFELQPEHTDAGRAEDGLAEGPRARPPAAHHRLDHQGADAGEGTPQQGLVHRGPGRFHRCTVRLGRGGRRGDRANGGDGRDVPGSARH
mmetsp:Transcript_160696/g.515783  ORF Transcript_160696/g.515783 Transcript_160696/m.515783 type:complete len:342 (+) Transcript_160696:7917-8942(+)